MKFNKLINIQRPGQLSFNDNKLRITTDKETTSVLFEDISSLSIRIGSSINLKFLIIGILSLFVGYFISTYFFLDIELNPSPLNFWNFLKYGFYITGFGSIFYSFTKLRYWDNVVVETRGGLLVIFSVLHGDGMKYLEDIEMKKRVKS